jgi:hypothetical protein
MRWSSADYDRTPMPEIDECEAWMREESERIAEARRDAEREAERRRLRR